MKTASICQLRSTRRDTNSKFTLPRIYNTCETCIQSEMSVIIFNGQNKFSSRRCSFNCIYKNPQSVYWTSKKPHLPTFTDYPAINWRNSSQDVSAAKNTRVTIDRTRNVPRFFHLWCRRIELIIFALSGPRGRRLNEREITCASAPLGEV